MENKSFENLLAINRNANGDYYFIYSVPNVRNNINAKAKGRNEVLIVGVPQKKLISYLRGCIEDHSEMFYAEGTKEELKL